MNGIIEHDVLSVEECPVSPVTTDEELLLAYREQGSRPAFEELVRRYEKELYGYLRNYLGDAEMAEDVFQQTFLQIYLKCDQFEPDRKLRPWLYAVATNQAIDHQRRFGRHRMTSLDRRMGSDEESDTGAFVDLFDSHHRGPVEETEKHERADEVRRAVDELPEQTRQVVLLIYFQGLKYREAAHALGIPVGTVKSRLHGGIHKLGEALAIAPNGDDSRS
jgi:RNA polymerase sigma-70 factor (ECF subfamily)